MPPGSSGMQQRVACGPKPSKQELTSTDQVICILLCVVLKLCACAIQQKIIGQLLGSRQWIRHMVGARPRSKESLA